MSSSSPARERILDAAATVLNQRGVAGATTRELARAAGYSEGMLYKYFSDKQELFLAVLSERMPRIELPEASDRSDLPSSLESIVTALLVYFTRTFPLSVSIFSTPDLLAEHRDGVRGHGAAGPEGVVPLVVNLLVEEQATGRIRADADLEAAAHLLVGLAFHRAFIAAYEGDMEVMDASDFAARGIRLVVPSLEPTD
ncbi:helix-turn-helix domain-containing protein [Agromyces sp. NPDC049794]|uniref:TetR/AcrR family transcriptional regulator n=1 Tax=unclassified Agromyces TaxID=2639701 RepID=UPI0033F5A6B1